MSNIMEVDFRVAKDGYEIYDKYPSYSEEDKELLLMRGICKSSAEVESYVERKLAEPPEKYVRPINYTGYNRAHLRNSSTYDFSDTEGVFIEFSGIPARDELGLINLERYSENICRFANKFGLLHDTTGSRQELFSIWVRRAESMKHAYDLYKALKNNNHEELNNLIFFDDKKKLFYQKELIPFGDRSYEARIVNKMLHLYAKQLNSITDVAWHVLSIYITDKLKSILSAQLIPNKYNTGADMNFRANNLVGGMWLQFANTVSRNIEHRQCVECDTFFEVKAKKRRHEKIYCSNKCNKRAAARVRRQREKDYIVAFANGYKGTLAEYIAEQKEESK